MKLTFVAILAIASLTSAQVFAQPSPPDGIGTPDGQRTPGGSRPESKVKVNCKATDEPLTALVPENGKGLTTAEYPSFWFYIPDAPEDVESIEFSLHHHNQDEKSTFYRTSLQLTKTPGVIGISLPQTSGSSLKINESYHWYFRVNCKAKHDIVIDGWVTRVQPSPNLWYDELANLAKQYLFNPQNAEVKKAWANLLQSVGLGELAPAPLVDTSAHR